MSAVARGGGVCGVAQVERGGGVSGVPQVEKSGGTGGVAQVEWVGGVSGVPQAQRVGPVRRSAGAGTGRGGLRSERLSPLVQRVTGAAA